MKFIPAIRNPRSGFKAQSRQERIAQWEQTITAECDAVDANEDLFVASILEEWIDEAIQAVEVTRLKDFILQVEEGKLRA